MGKEGKRVVKENANLISEIENLEQELIKVRNKI